MSWPQPWWTPSAGHWCTLSDLHPMHQFSTSGIAQAARRRVLQASDAALGQKLGSAVVTQVKRMYHMFVKKEGFQSSVQIAETLYTWYVLRHFVDSWSPVPPGMYEFPKKKLDERQFISKNERLELKKKLKRHIDPKPLIFGFHVSFQGCLSRHPAGRSWEKRGTTLGPDIEPE